MAPQHARLTTGAAAHSQSVLENFHRIDQFLADQPALQFDGAAGHAQAAGSIALQAPLDPRGAALETVKAVARIAGLEVPDVQEMIQATFGGIPGLNVVSGVAMLSADTIKTMSAGVALAKQTSSQHRTLSPIEHTALAGTINRASRNLRRSATQTAQDAAFTAVSAITGVGGTAVTGAGLAARTATAFGFLANDYQLARQFNGASQRTVQLVEHTRIPALYVVHLGLSRGHVPNVNELLGIAPLGWKSDPDYEWLLHYVDQHYPWLDESLMWNGRTYSAPEFDKATEAVRAPWADAMAHLGWLYSTLDKAIGASLWKLQTQVNGVWGPAHTPNSRQDSQVAQVVSGLRRGVADGRRFVAQHLPQSSQTVPATMFHPGNVRPSAPARQYRGGSR